MPRQEVNVFSRRQPLGISRQQSGLTGRTTYGARQRTGVQAAAYGRGPAPAPAPARAPGNALAPSDDYGTADAPASTAPSPNAMSPAERSAFAQGAYGGYPGTIAGARTPGAVSAIQAGYSVPGALMRTLASPLMLGYSLYGGIQAAQEQAARTRSAAYTTTIGAPGDPTYGQPQEQTVNPAEPLRATPFKNALARMLGMQTMSDYMSADPMSDRGGYGGNVGPGITGGDVDVSNVGPQSGDYGRQQEGFVSDPGLDPGAGGGGGGDGGGHGGGLGGGEGGEGDTGSGDTGAGLGAGHGGDADSEGGW